MLAAGNAGYLQALEGAFMEQNTVIRAIITTVALGLAVSACNAPPQRPAIDPALESGVTSSNGGGQRTTGAIPNIDIGSGGAVRTGVPSARGNAY